MYIPTHFDEPNTHVLHELIRERPLATLVVLTEGGLEANHIPLHLSVDAALGTLRGHVARANPLWQEYRDTVDAIAIFHGPDAYISPGWYETKKETGKVVPTWNYAVAHAYGKLRFIHDAAWIRAQLEALTQHNESGFARPWSVSDAPHDYTEQLIKAVVGMEMTITRLIGKWKVSQNQPQRNQASVVQGLLGGGDQDALRMAEMVKQAAVKQK